MRSIFASLAICWMLLVAASGALARASASVPSTVASVYHIPRTEQPIAVDGVLDDSGWDEALVLELNYETTPGENVAPPVRTVCRLTYSSSHLYYGCHAYDDPQQIRARLSDRDQAGGDDTVGLAIDPFDSQNRTFVLDVNPLGVQNDRLYTEADGHSDPSWDAIWDSAGRIVADGFVVEAGIPFSSLRFPRTAGQQTWSFMLRRYQPRGVYRRIALSPLDRNDRCRICQNPKLVGFEGIDPGRNLEVTPTLTGVSTTSRASFPEGELKRDDPDFDPGLNVRWGMTPNLTLNGALKPDFSQVEADVAQLAVNEQFALFFPERRPFFLEGADFFRTPIQAVYTRSVADPSWGLKVTGKEGRHALGAFVARDELTNLLLPGSEGSSFDFIGRQSSSAVLRYRRDLAQASTVGMLFTGREAGDYSNRVGGFDTRLRLDRANTLHLQVLGAQTTYPRDLAERNGLPADQLHDYAFDFSYRHNRRNWETGLSYVDIGEDFRADLGFMPRVGIRQVEVGGQYRWFGDSDNWFTELRVGGEVQRTDGPDGGLLEEDAYAFVEYNGSRQSYLSVGTGVRDRAFQGVVFDQSYGWIFGFIRPTSDLGLGLGIDAGDDIDFGAVRPGRQLTLSPSINYNFGKHLRGLFLHTYRELDVDAGNLFEANLSELRLVYQINVRTFVRAIVQYTRLERDRALYGEEIEPSTDDLLGQLLFSYKVNPQTAFFLGYTGSYLRLSGEDLIETGNTLFLKVGYAWQP